MNKYRVEYKLKERADRPLHMEVEAYRLDLVKREVVRALNREGQSIKMREVTVTMVERI